MTFFGLVLLMIIYQITDQPNMHWSLKREAIIQKIDYLIELIKIKAEW